MADDHPFCVALCDRVLELLLFVELGQRLRRIEIEQRAFGLEQHEMIGGTAERVQHRVAEWFLAAISLGRRHCEDVYVEHREISDGADSDRDAKGTESANRIDDGGDRYDPE